MPEKLKENKKREQYSSKAEKKIMRTEVTVAGKIHSLETWGNFTYYKGNLEREMKRKQKKKTNSRD